jgi:copper homeostasis protein
MKKIETELCAYSLEDVATGVDAGVTRVELCTSPLEGGTTPSAAAIAMAREMISLAAAESNHSVELSVMIRPRGGDFLYSELEFRQMQREVAFVRECGADGVVFGLLTAEGDVDTERTRRLVELAGPMECTFHRAFDVAREPLRALEDIISVACRRILTSGQRGTAIEGVELLGDLVVAAAGRVEIMAGSGVNPSNARQIAARGVSALHFSARKAHPSGMRYRNPAVSFSCAGAADDEICRADPDFVRKIVTT